MSTSEYGPEQAVKPAVVARPAPWVRVNDALVGMSRQSPDQQRAAKAALYGKTAFSLPDVAPGVLKKGHEGGQPVLANDSQVMQINAWAAEQVYAGSFYNGVQFMGYTYLAELAQVPEYRRIVEITATELTRKWIMLQGDEHRVQELNDELERLAVRDHMHQMAEVDGFFGRAHLYLDTGDTDKPDELKTDIGNGRNAATRAKFEGQKGFLKRLQVVEPVWCYPAKYTSNNPLARDWYNPQTWLCMGTEIHVSRFITLVGRPVPDMLKPSYAFGGMSLSQMAKPYVDNWLRTRQSVADLIWSFSVSGLETDLSTLSSEGGDELLKRAQLFSNLRTNQGLMLLQKDQEKFFNVSVPLAGLHELQSQAQEHQCSVVGIPVVKLLGVQPAGLNASSEGELTTWYDWCMAFKKKLYSEALDALICLAQMNIWGQVDPGISWDFEPMRELTEKEKADVNKAKADTDVALVGAGIIDPTESRERLSGDPDSGFEGISEEPPSQLGLNAPGAVPGQEAQPAVAAQLGGAPGEVEEEMASIGLRPPDLRREQGREEGTERRPEGERREPRRAGPRFVNRRREPRTFARG